ncbi:MAG: hypothetical protein UT39_C0001G0028 [Candidatus Woesebacteria bacterium GW2011_GWA1_39_21]|uniref:Uncharacterized protein n=1 Tax=Candidatus Woesebacteria bacterium GW2011_GWA1_39_21 TaxID=1618550 RepID=A0A0G0N930_9BACT|nr:MAG: hypothetical protein UT39_C0001G0028 [Candidatus Woesebacteria bacterium GW2011_GWA1_39_21]
MESVLLTVLVSVFCGLTFLFIFWKNLKDDYMPSQIFSVGFIVLISFALGFFLSGFASTYRFWILFIAIVIGYIIGYSKSKIKFYEGLDSLTIALAISLIPSALFFINDWSLDLFLFYLSLALSCLVYFSVRRYYKTFIWYKSGKRGFSGLFTLGVVFLFRSVVSIVKPDYTLFLTEYDIFISGLISFSAFLNIFILGEK